MLIWLSLELTRLRIKISFLQVQNVLATFLDFTTVDVKLMSSRADLKVVFIKLI